LSVLGADENPSLESTQPKLKELWKNDVVDGGDAEAILEPSPRTYRCRTYAHNSESRSNSAHLFAFRTDDDDA
jgi:hypothetical protein